MTLLMTGRSSPRSPEQLQRGWKLLAKGGANMNRGFWRGVITGSLVGAAVSLLVLPQLRPDTRAKLLARSHDIGRRAKTVIRRVRDDAGQMIEGR